jgi:hypothetical protein
MTHLCKLTDLSTKIVISAKNSIQQISISRSNSSGLLVVLAPKDCTIIRFFHHLLWAWNRELWKLFQKLVVHTTLDIHVCIAELKIQIEQIRIYSLFWRTNFFFKEKLTWFEALRCCASRSGQLATIDDQIGSCRKIPSGAKSLWTGNVRRHSEWIEFQGKLNEMCEFYVITIRKA